MRRGEGFGAGEMKGAGREARSGDARRGRKVCKGEMMNGMGEKYGAGEMYGWRGRNRLHGEMDEMNGAREKCGAGDVWERSEARREVGGTCVRVKWTR